VDRVDYLVLSETFKNELYKGLDFKIAIKVLVDAKWLIPGADGKTAQKPYTPGYERPRCYVFSSALWDRE